MYLRLALLVVAAFAAFASEASATVIAEGRFGRTAMYTGTGRAVVESSRGARTLKLSRDFSASAAIELRLYLATSPSGRTHVDLGRMAKRGAQSFRIPRGVSIRKYRYVIAWCVTVNEPVTRARLR